MAQKQTSLRIDLVDGARRPFAAGTSVVFRKVDSANRIETSEVQYSSYVFANLPFHDNFQDTYYVSAVADGFRQAGYGPVQVAEGKQTIVKLMLVPDDPQPGFSDWSIVRARFPVLTAGAANDAEAKARYQGFCTTHQESVAALLNITTGMSEITLPSGKTALDYLAEINWDTSLEQDRFFGYCDPALIDDVKAAEQRGEFATASVSDHPGATRSWKELRLEFGNVQLTFHENDKKMIAGRQCVLIEPDIDYYPDGPAHIVFEYIPNNLSGGLTNPEIAYQMRWMATEAAGDPEFAPPYVFGAETA